MIDAYDAYLDESGIHKGATVCVIAGYYGEHEPMKEFERAWKRTLEDHPFPMKDFHARGMVGKRDCESLLLKLAKVIEKQESVYSISQSIVVKDFLSLPEDVRRWMTGGQQTSSGKWRRQGCPEKSYFVPFQSCLQRITDFVPAGGKAHFFFGLDRTFSRYALDLFERIKKLPRKPSAEWKGQDRLGMPAFPLASETAQLQAADLLVHLSYQRAFECIEGGLSFQEIPVSEMPLCCIRNTYDQHDHEILDEEHLIAKLLKAHIKTREDIGGQ